MDLPLSFGKVAPSRTAGADERIAKTRRVEAKQEQRDEDGSSHLAQPTVVLNGSDQDDDDGEDGSLPLDEALDWPISHEAVLSDHSKTVSALDIDQGGARICTGGYDYQSKLWDFGGMDAAFKPFKTWECWPEGSYQVNDCKFSNNGDRILIINATLQPKMYSRDGQVLETYTKGDVYIRDMKNTSGHVAEITSCAWHPKDVNTFITASNDSTVRIWDATKRDKQKSVIVVKSKERGQRTHVTATTFTEDGRYIAAAGLDGAVNVWAANSNMVRPNYSVDNAHVKNTIMSGITFSLDNHTLLTRGNDNTLKMWDFRSFKKPIHVNAELPNHNQETNVVFSPDENYIVTGTAGGKIKAGSTLIDNPDVKDGNTEGKLVVLRRSDLSVVRSLGISAGNVVKCCWHPRINQILASTSLGAVHVLYSPEHSIRGATMSVSRQIRKRANADLNADGTPAGQILTPDALPMFKDSDRLLGRTGKRKRERDRQDPVKTMKPLPPVVGPGSGGRVGASATQHVVQGLVFNHSRDEDPREALLKYADKTAGDSVWTSAWKKTQPKAIFDETPYEEEYDEAGKLIDRRPKTKESIKR